MTVQLASNPGTPGWSDCRAKSRDQNEFFGSTEADYTVGGLGWRSLFEDKQPTPKG